MCMIKERLADVNTYTHTKHTCSKLELHYKLVHKQNTIMNTIYRYISYNPHTELLSCNATHYYVASVSGLVMCTLDVMCRCSVVCWTISVVAGGHPKHVIVMFS